MEQVLRFSGLPHKNKDHWQITRARLERDFVKVALDPRESAEIR
jgi:hypothetical protein